MDEKQSKRSKDGAAFEHKMYEFVCDCVKDIPSVRVGKGAKSPDKAAPSFNFYTAIGVFTVDADIVITDADTGVPRVVISVKISLRERASEVVASHLMIKGKYPNVVTFLATQDKGDGTGKSEFGTDENPRKPRMMLLYNGITTFSERADTAFGPTVRPMSELREHIKQALLCK